MYIPLRVQSCYSMLESTIELKALAALCREQGIPAVGLADHGNLFAAMAFASAALAAGVQPVIGTMLPVRQRAGRNGPPGLAASDSLVLFAQNNDGWHNLMALSSDSHLEGDLSLAALSGRSDGLLCLSGGVDGALTRLFAEGQGEEARALADDLQALFPDRFYIELMRSGEAIAGAAEDALLALAHEKGLPVVATNKACFLTPAGHEAHDAMLCIADGSYLDSAERRRSNPLHYFQTGAEMAARFADLPEAIANTELVARRTAFAPEKRKPVLPKLVEDREEERATLRRLAEDGLRARLAARPVGDEAPYWDRLSYELGIIGDMDFAGYFLIVADFVHWSKEHGVPVGPGRGSGAGSITAWALRITDLDPLALGLIFERFLNPERKSMPDFDIDFCETRREEVIHYVQEKYGRARVAQIITFGTLKARAVVKDVGRVMQLPYGQVNRLSNLIPANPADPWDLRRALANIPELKAEVDADPKVQHLIDVALQLEGRPRHSSTHAAGVVIGDRPLAELVPLYRDPRSDFPVSQFDLKWSEAAGLVKFDFLGLKTLSMLARAKELLQARGVAVDLDSLPMDDQDVFSMMTRGDTFGVFQFESDGMRRALALVKPTLFEDLIALGALYRPGPMDNIPSFAARKWGREAPDYLHPMLEPILRPTYGVIIYQEQVMQIAQVLAGYSLGEADLLRRAMGKKIKAEMDAQRSRFLEGAARNGVDRAQAEHIFDLVDKFAGYGFNKSHAAAYALVAWQTAWLKCHHPAAFYAASMDYDSHLTDRLAGFADDMRRLAVGLLPPSLNDSEARFSLEDDEGAPAVRYGLAALKGIGEGAMQALVAERQQGGRFADVNDLVQRMDPHAVNRRQVEVLAAAGALDCLHVGRATACAAADRLVAAAASASEERQSGQGGLFGEGGGAALALPEVAEWGFAERLAHEHEAFGYWFTGHPVDAYRAILTGLAVEDAASVLDRRGAAGSRGSVRMAGLVEGTRWRTPQGRGADRRYLIVDLSDRSGRWSASCFDSGVQDGLLAAAAAGEALLFDVELQWRDGDDPPRLAIQRLQPLRQLAATTRLKLHIAVERGADPDLARQLLAALPRRGGSIVEVAVPLGSNAGPNTSSEAVLRLGSDFELSSIVEQQVAALPGVREAVLSAPGHSLRLVAD